MDTREFVTRGIRFAHVIKGQELGHAYLYLMQNDLHKEPFGFVEDVFVDKESRGQGIGDALMEAVLRRAKEEQCYK